EEGRLVRDRMDSRGVLEHEAAPGSERPGIGVPHPATHEDLAGREVKVAAAASAAARNGRPGKPLDIGEARADVCLVGRLVLREADVAVDPERRFGGIRRQRDVLRAEPLVQRRAVLLERWFEETLELRLARLEPGAIVVLGEVREELDGAMAETRKRTDSDGH